MDGSKFAAGARAHPRLAERRELASGSDPDVAAYAIADVKKFRTSRGSALILSLWALLLLSAAVFAWVKLIEQDIAVSGDANSALDARALAESGVAIALAPARDAFHASAAKPAQP